MANDGSTLKELLKKSASNKSQANDGSTLKSMLKTTSKPVTSTVQKQPVVTNNDNSNKKTEIESRMSELDKLMKDTDTKLRRIGYTETERNDFQNQYKTYKDEYYSLKKELDTMEIANTKFPTSDTNMPKAYFTNPVEQSVGDKVANFFKVTLPEAAEDTWDDIKEPFTGPSLKQVMTEAKLSPKLLVEDAKIQMEKEDPTREDYALVKQTQEAIKKYGMPDSNIRAITEDTTKLQEQLKSAEKTWQVSPVDAAVANTGAAAVSIFGNLGSFANSIGADKVPLLREVTNFAVDGARKAQENAQQYNKGSYGETLGAVTQGIVNLAPYFVLGTGKVAVKGATSVSKYGKYIEPIIKNPSFWYSLTSMWGQKYQEKLDEGYNRIQALGNAIIYALPASLIEVSGGIGAQGKEAQSLLKTMGEEIAEEISQDIMSGVSDKIVTNHDLPVFSTTEDAIINPKNLAKTALYTAPIVGIAGGVSNIRNNYINRNNVNQQQVQEGKNTVLPTAKETTTQILENSKVLPKATQNYSPVNSKQVLAEPNISRTNGKTTILPTAQNQSLESRKNAIIEEINNNSILSNEDKQGIIEVIKETQFNSQMENSIREMLNVVNTSVNEELTNISNNFDKNKAKYVQYSRDIANYDTKYIENAKNTIKTKDGKRTKEQWLSVAKAMGNQIYEMSNADIEMYAFKSWIENKPNNAQNLNRQGKKYVKFGMDEWVNTIYNTVNTNRARTQTTTNENTKTENKNSQLALPPSKMYVSPEGEAMLPETFVEYEKGKLQLPTPKTQQTYDTAVELKVAPEVANKVMDISKKIDVPVKFFEVDSTIDGFYENGVININKNSPKPEMKIFKHELTHHLKNKGEYSKVSKAIMNSNVFYDMLAEKGMTLDEYRNSIIKNYGEKGIKLDTEMANEEIIAKFAEEKLFNDEASIERLAQTNPYLITRIKQWIDDVVVKFKGTSEEKELRKIQNMYKKALEQARENTKKSGVKYSFAGEVGLENLKARYEKMSVRQKEFVNELENNYQKAIYLSSKGYKNDQILKETSWFQSDGKWKWEIPDEYFKLKDDADLSNGEHRLSEIIDHDLIFMVYPELKNQKVKISNVSGRSLYNSVDKTIKLKIGEKSNSQIEASLLHEVQHAIQEIEGFDGGTSTLGGMLRYYEKPGEIEAADTVRRFMHSKVDKTFSREYVAPELSKDNPKHPTLDKYLAGETKKQTPIRDNLYQKSKEKGNGIYEKIDRKALQMEIDETDNGQNIRFDNGGRFRRHVNDTAGKEPAFSMPENKENLHYQGNNLGSGKTIKTGIKVSDSYGKVNQELTKYTMVYDESMKEAIEQLKRVEGKPNSDIKIYRASPSDKINDGDWVYLSKEQAEKWIKTHFGTPKPNYLVTEMTVKANDVEWTGKNMDFVYNPQTAIPETDNQGRNQIKAVDNSSPTESVDIRYSMNNESKNESNVEQSDVLETIAPQKEQNIDDIEEEVKVANVLTKPPKKRVPDKLETAKDVLARKLLDTGNTINKVAKISNDKILYPLFNNTKQARQSAEYMIGEKQTDIQGNVVGNSLVEIFRPIKAKGEEYTKIFYEYLLHMHNIDRMAQNKPVFGETVKAEDSQRIANELLEKYPEFEKLANKVYVYNRNLMQWRVDSGLVSKEQADEMNKMYPHYVPTFRDMSGTAGAKVNKNGIEISKTIKKATGSTKNILPLDLSMARQTMQTVQAARRNLFGNRLLNDAITNKDKLGEYINTIQKSDSEVDIDSEKDPNLDYTTNNFTIYRNGKATTMKVNNGIFEGLKSISAEIDNTDNNKLMATLAAPNRTFKQLVTGMNPMFLAKNFSRDIQDSFLYSKNLRKFIKNYPGTFKDMVNNSKEWQLYKSFGGTGSSFFDYETGIDRVLNKGKWNKVSDNTMGRIEELNMMIEQAPRFSEFKSTIEKAGNTNYDTLMEAMYNAADITVNFGRSGSWVKMLNSSFVPFLNPSVQGTDKIIRTIANTHGGEEWAKLVTKAALFGMLPSLINELLYGDDEDYQNLTDRDKDVNFILKYGDNKWLKIPKGRIVSFVGNLVNRGVRIAKGQDVEWGEFLSTAADQTAPISPFESNIISPILAVKNNTTWYGSDIVPQRLQGYKPGEQYDEKTDKFSKWLGGLINYSPKKINYLIDAYTGVIGDFALPLTTPYAETNPFTKAFTIDGEFTNEISNKFYKAKEKYDKKQNSKPSAPVVTRYLNKQNDMANDLYAEIRNIQNSDLPDAEKIAKARELRELINLIEATALTNLEAYEKAADKHINKFPNDSDKSVDYAYIQANNELFGAEYAVKTYSKSKYEKNKNKNMKSVLNDILKNFKSDNKKSLATQKRETLPTAKDISTRK